MAKLRVGFLMDPIERIEVGHDSTFALMLETQRRGHELRYFMQHEMSVLAGAATAPMRHLEVRREPGNHYTVRSTDPLPLGELDVLFLRKDPPVDIEFLHATQLVELCPGRKPLYINAPDALRTANEKLYALRFPKLCPLTLVSRDMDELRRFALEHPDGAVFKPLDGFAGRGVVRAIPGDKNLNALLELVTRQGTELVVAQRFIPAASEGDKRILLVGGEPVGAVLRVASGEDFRCNMAAGGAPQKATITDRDREICAALRDDFIENGLEFVGIDVIGGLLIEVNVTSPTGIEEIDRLDGISVESLVLDRVEQLASTR